MGHRLARSMIEYYVALRISASAATAFWPLMQLREPQPIVRIAVANQLDAGGFDVRETWTAADGGCCVITLPQCQLRDDNARCFPLN